jgi:hypothetical protein
MAAHPYINHYKIKELAERLWTRDLLRGTDDKRPRRNLRDYEAVAAKITARQERREAQSTPLINTRVTASNAQEWFINRILVIARNMNLYADMQRKKPAPKPVEPAITSNPLIVSEPVTPSNVVPLRPEKSAPLIHATFRSATVIPDTEFAPLVAASGHVTEAWRNSIQVNEAIARERHARSLAYQAAMKSKYIG